MTKMTHARQGRLASPRALVLSLATVAAALASGCADDLDVSTSDEALTQVVTPIETGGATRYKLTVDGETCDRECLRWVTEDTVPPSRQCVQWGGVVCEPWRNTYLAASTQDLSDRSRPKPFKSFGATPSPYLGCGPEAAQNVLAYIGSTSTIQHVASMINTIDVPLSDQIATTPQSLEQGLERLLTNLGSGRYNVRRESGKTLHYVKQELDKGFPVIALVNNGTHWVTITAYRSSGLFDEFHIIDYNEGQGRWVLPVGVDLDIGFPNSWASVVSFGYQGYRAGTVLSIEYTEVPPRQCECDVVGEQPCGRNGTGTQMCDGCQLSVCVPAGSSDPFAPDEDVLE
jgi:hypothetical protein